MTNGKGMMFGKHSSEIGFLYEGWFKDGLKHGLGRIIYENCKVIIGKWENGILNRGEIFDYKDIKYKGEIRDAKRHGIGYFEIYKGELVEGDWLEDILHGKVFYTRANGDTLEGEYINMNPIGIHILNSKIGGTKTELKIS